MMGDGKRWMVDGRWEMGDGRWQMSGCGAAWWYKERGSVFLFGVNEGLIPTLPGDLAD